MDASFFPDDCPASIKKRTAARTIRTAAPLRSIMYAKELCEWANWLVYKFPKKTSGRASIQPDLELSFTSQPRWEIFTLNLISGYSLRSACCETLNECLFFLFGHLSDRRLFGFKRQAVLNRASEEVTRGNPVRPLKAPVRRIRSFPKYLFIFTKNVSLNGNYDFVVNGLSAAEEMLCFKAADKPW